MLDKAPKERLLKGLSQWSEGWAKRCDYTKTGGNPYLSCSITKSQTDSVRNLVSKKKMTGSKFLRGVACMCWIRWTKSFHRLGSALLLNFQQGPIFLGLNSNITVYQICFSRSQASSLYLQVSISGDISHHKIHLHYASSKISTLGFHGGKLALDTGVLGTSLILWKQIDLLSDF